jgi:hypothetical protein
MRKVSLFDDARRSRRVLDLDPVPARPSLDRQPSEKADAVLLRPVYGTAYRRVEPKRPLTGLPRVPDGDDLLSLGDSLALGFRAAGASPADLMKLAFFRNAFVQFFGMFDVIFKFTVSLG